MKGCAIALSRPRNQLLGAWRVEIFRQDERGPSQSALDIPRGYIHLRRLLVSVVAPLSWMVWTALVLASTIVAAALQGLTIEVNAAAVLAVFAVFATTLGLHELSHVIVNRAAGGHCDLVLVTGIGGAAVVQCCGRLTRSWATAASLAAGPFFAGSASLAIIIAAQRLAAPGNTGAFVAMAGGWRLANEILNLVPLGARCDGRKLARELWLLTTTDRDGRPRSSNAPDTALTADRRGRP
jgi:hypothetical protein